MTEKNKKLIEMLKEIIESANSYYAESNPNVPIILEDIVLNATRIIELLK